MKYIEVHQGETFSLSGALFTITEIEKDSVQLKDVRTGKRITYGLEALQRIVMRFGYRIIA